LFLNSLTIPTIDYPYTGVSISALIVSNFFQKPFLALILLDIFQTGVVFKIIDRCSCIGFQQIQNYILPWSPFKFKTLKSLNRFVELIFVFSNRFYECAKSKIRNSCDSKDRNIKINFFEEKFVSYFMNSNHQTLYMCDYIYIESSWVLTPPKFKRSCNCLTRDKTFG